MPSDTNKPVRAAKAAAIKNAVWLAPASAVSKQKRRRSPDAPSATVKQKRICSTNEPLAGSSTSLGADTLKARTVGKMRTPKPKPRPVAQDQGKGKGKAKAKPNPEQGQDASRLCHIPMVIADSDEDGLNEDGEDIDPGQGKGGSVTMSDGEYVTDKEQDDIGTLDAQAVRARFKEEVVDWGTADAVEQGTLPENSLLSSGEDEDENPVLAKPIGNRAANRLAEVPQWEERPADVPTTCTDSDPLSSGEEGDIEIDKLPQVSTFRYSVNMSWPLEAHYVPANGQPMISLRCQPQPLRTVAKFAINRTLADLAFDDAYPPIDGLTNYLRLTLCRSARYLRLTGYAKRFEQDAEFGRAFGRVINSRISIFRGQAKRNAASKVEGHYHLIAGQFTAETIKELLQFSNYIYPKKKGPDGHGPLYQRSKPFSHPAIIAVMRHEFFVPVRGGSIAARNGGRFKSSLAAHPKELEVPDSMLALAATSVHSALDDYTNGVLRKTDFNADMYEDVYRRHMQFLAHIREGSATKYHRLMAGLYEEASNVSAPGVTSVSNDAILQLDLAGMEE